MRLTWSGLSIAGIRRFPGGVLWLPASVAAFLAQHAADSTKVPGPVIGVTLLAIILAWLGAPKQPGRSTTPPAGCAACPPARLIPVGCLFLLPALVAAYLWSREPFAQHLVFVRASSTWAAWLWLSGMGAGLVVLCRPCTWLSRGRLSIYLRRARAGGVECAVLVAIVVLAVLLRTWRLGDVPPAVGYDEADSALDSMRLFALPFQALGPANWGHNPSLYFYAMALLFKLLGATIAVARLTSVLFGVVGVVGVYLVGRSMLGPVLGLSGAALLAVSGWSIHFSRFAIMDIAVPTLVSLGLAASLVGMRRRDPSWFAVAGILFGLIVMTYAGGFLSVTALTFWVVGYVYARARPAERRAMLPKVLLLPLCLLVAAMPFLAMLHLDPGYTLWREHQISLFSVVSGRREQFEAVVTNLRIHLLMFTVMGDRGGANNLPGQPMLDTVTGSCFLLGLGMCLRNVRAWFAQVLLLWLGAGLLSGILSNPGEAPEAARTIGVVAPVALIAALPLTLLGEWIARSTLPPRWSGRAGKRARERERAWAMRRPLVATIMVTLPIAAALAQTTQIYFSVYDHSLGARNVLDGPATTVARAVAPLANKGYRVLVPEEPSMPDVVLRFVGGFVYSRYDLANPHSMATVRPGSVVVVPGADSVFVARLGEMYGSARVQRLTPPFDPGSVDTWLVIIPPASHAGPRPAPLG